ncbi:hypothetical protein BX666DRAFT_1936192 [Dichotomocladium elegans]|nr:hypothetical protein BX666DRAFT_1936192 [Dichotomocladium elegans]
MCMYIALISLLFCSDQFVAIDLIPPERDISSMIDGIHTKKSLFDTFSLDPSSITTDCPKYNILHNHLQLPLRDDKSVTAMLIQKPISRTEISDWAKNNEKTAKSTADTTTVRFTESIGSDARVKDFIKKFRRRPPRNLDAASDQFLDFMDDLADELNDEERVDAIEAYICSELYDCLFSTPGGDEPLQDEALESRIAALNLLDLSLSHLGVIVEDDADIRDINAVVKKAGMQLQQLNSIPDAKGKLEGIVRTHQIVVGN